MKQLQGVIAFIETASAGSLAGAARRLDVSPAAVSKNLLKLERQLGVRLLQRSTRRLRLSEEGERFLEKARGALRALDEAVAEVLRSAESPTGTVRLSVGTAFGRRWVLPALPQLARRYPELALQVDLDNRPVDMVAEGYDIGIRGGTIEDSSLVARRICALPTVLLASPAYLRRAGVPVSASDLAKHACLQMRFADGHHSVWRLHEGKSRRLVEFQPLAAISANDSEAVIDLALAEGGIAQAGLYHALPYLRSGRLKLVLGGSHDAGRREFVLHYPHRLYLAPRVRVVVDHLLAHFAASPDLHLLPADLPAAFHALPVGERGEPVRAPRSLPASPN